MVLTNTLNPASAPSGIKYRLPEDRIALFPSFPRDSCRLMAVRLSSLNVEDVEFKDIADYLEPGDAIAINDSRVIPARLKGIKETGGRAEFLLIEKKDHKWKAMGKPASRLQPGMEVEIMSIKSARCRISILEKFSDGFFLLDTPDNILDYGYIPLPPYINSRRETTVGDFEDYQTIFASSDGSVASPTSSIHFTDRLVNNLDKKGIKIAPLTLHIGTGTFRTDQDRPDKEWYSINEGTAGILNRATNICVCGTTVMRAIESSYSEDKLVSSSGETDLFIRPGYRFRTRAMFLTNFHLPGTPLLLMVAAYLEEFFPGRGKEVLMQLYKRAIDKEYRFLSYGDAMLLIGR